MENAEHKSVKVKGAGGDDTDFFRYTFEAKGGLGILFRRRGGSYFRFLEAKAGGYEPLTRNDQHCKFSVRRATESTE
jgi:hypothetical protein